MIPEGVISLEPSQETPANGAANVDAEIPGLNEPLPTLSKVNDPSSPVVAVCAVFPEESISLTWTPGIPSSPCSAFPGVPPPGLKSRQTTPVIDPGFGCGIATCLADDGTSVGGMAVRPSSAVPPAGIAFCRT